jgi:hypothetical protein
VFLALFPDNLFQQQTGAFFYYINAQDRKQCCYQLIVRCTYNLVSQKEFKEEWKDVKNTLKQGKKN